MRTAAAAAAAEAASASASASASAAATVVAAAAAAAAAVVQTNFHTDRMRTEGTVIQTNFHTDRLRTAAAGKVTCIEIVSTHSAEDLSLKCFSSYRFSFGRYFLGIFIVCMLLCVIYYIWCKIYTVRTVYTSIYLQEEQHIHQWVNIWFYLLLTLHVLTLVIVIV
jgi:hypothetical protein